MIMNGDSFESPGSYLFALSLKNSIATLLKCVILAKSNPSTSVAFQSHTTVSRTVLRFLLKTSDKLLNETRISCV